MSIDGRRPERAATLRIPDGATPSLRELAAPYARPDHRRAALQLLNTLPPFAVVVGVMTWSLEVGVWWAALLAIPAAGLLVRMFMIQHDCGHGSFLRARWANDLVGRIIGVLTLTPYLHWQRSHARHHATSGNLDRRGDGEITTMTVREYLSLSWWRRLAYRTYRHPLVLFGVGPAYQFLLRHRIPVGHPLRNWRGWLSTIGTNVALGVIVVAVVALGIDAFLLGYLLTMITAASIGVWLFHVQHQFEATYWERGAGWNFQAAALVGCSFYDLPGVLHWLTANIGLHHIHHLASRIPNYRLRECFEQIPALHQVTRFTLWSSFKCAGLALWDEERRKLVPFSTLR